MNIILGFIFSYIGQIILIFWVLFLILVSIRYFYTIRVSDKNIDSSSEEPKFFLWIKNISYLKFFYITLGIHIFYSTFLSCALYYVWRITYPAGIAKFSYFLSYIFMHFWLNVILLVLVSGALYVVFRVWRNYRGGFSHEGPMLLLVLMLISGWPGILVSIVIGFIFSILLMIFHLIKSVIKKIPFIPVLIESAFIFSTLISLVFTNFILKIVIQ